jgi:hypothetical protein
MLPILRQSAHEGGKVVSPMHRPPLPREIFLVPISVGGWVDPRAIVRPEGICQWKNRVTPSGIEPATLRFVAQCLNHYATACPTHYGYKHIYCVLSASPVPWMYCSNHSWLGSGESWVVRFTSWEWEELVRKRLMEFTWCLYVCAYVRDFISVCAYARDCLYLCVRMFVTVYICVCVC